MRIRDEYLPKLPSRNPVHECLHPLVVNFVKDVVQEQNGFDACRLLDVRQLGQAQGNEEGLLLPL